MYRITLLAIIPFLLFGCSNNSSEEINFQITEVYPFEDGNEWNYQFIHDGDTTDGYMSFSSFQLSENSERAVVEISSDIENFVFVFEAKSGGICIDNPSESFSTVLENINTYETDLCTAFLKIPVQDGDSYTFSNTVSDRGYNYNVDVFEEAVTINETTYNSINYVIPSGKEPELFATQLFLNSEKGIIKLIPEAPDRELILVSTNF